MIKAALPDVLGTGDLAWTQKLTGRTLRTCIAGRLPDWNDETDDSGPFLWLGTHLDDADPIFHYADRSGVRIIAGSTLSPTDRWNAHICMAITADDDALIAALDRIADALTP